MSQTNNQINYTTWTIEEVYEWALKQHNGFKYATVLKEQDISGIHLGTLTEQQLTDVNQPYKLTGGSAKSLMSAIGMLKGSQQSTGGKINCSEIEIVVDWFLKKYGEPMPQTPLTETDLSLYGRDEVFKSIINNGVNRIQYNGDGVKNHHDFNVLYGAPGIGKTRILDAMGGKTQENGLLPKHQISINITFNSGTPYNTGLIQDSNPCLTLPTRVLYQYFVSGSIFKTDFEEFMISFNKTFNIATLTVKLSFRYILSWLVRKDTSLVSALAKNHEEIRDKSKLVLVNFGVDEFQRLLNDSETDEQKRRVQLKVLIRDHLSPLLLDPPIPFFFIITLAGTYIGEISKVIHQESAHNYNGIPLGFLSLEATRNIIKNTSLPISNPNIIRALDFTGGWPRPLSIMIKSISNNNPNNKTLEILSLTKEEFKKNYAQIDKNLYPIIIAYAISGLVIQENTIVPNSTTTFEKLQANGLLSFVNNVVELPLYFIYIYIDDINKLPYNAYPHHLKNMYTHLKLALNIVQDEFKFDQFEDFCAHYQKARMIAFHLIKSKPPSDLMELEKLPPQTITIEEFVGSDALYYPPELKNKTFEITNNPALELRPQNREPETTRKMKESTIILNTKGGLVDISTRFTKNSMIQYLFSSVKFTDNNNTFKLHELGNYNEVNLANILKVPLNDCIIFIQSNKRLTETMKFEFEAITGYVKEDKMTIDKEIKEVHVKEDKKLKLLEQTPNVTQNINTVITTEDQKYFSVFRRLLRFLD